MCVDLFRFFTHFKSKTSVKAPTKVMQTTTEDFSAAPEQHVAVLAFPFASHAAQLLSLVRRLATAAPDVTFSFYSTAESNESLFSITNPENIKAFDLSCCVPEGYVFSGKPQEEINLFLEVAEESFTAAMQAAEADIGQRISLLMSDAFLWFVGEMANRTRVPWVPVWISGAWSVSAHFYTDLIRETIGMKGQETQIVKFIPGFSELCLGDLPSGVLFGDIESPFSVMLHKMGQVLPKATAVAANSFEELDPEINKDLKSKFRNFLNVGPSNLTSPLPPSSMSDEYGCVRWLDKLKPASVAYIGFGTVAALPPNELVALAEALEASGTPFLWSLKENYRKNLPEGFAERTSGMGKIVPWAPQIQVLGHNSVGVFISHCGSNSLMETIAAGVPIIGRPVFGDHKLNAWMVENVWKIGVRVEGDVLTKSGAMLALERVLSREKGRKLKDQVGRLRELAFEAVGPNGSSARNFIALQEVVTGRHHI